MSKRRTKKEKQHARHPFTIAWSNNEENQPSGTLVKRQFIEVSPSEAKNKNFPKNPNILDKEIKLGSIKKDIFKSLILFSLIVGSEIVLYLVWL